MWWLLACGIEPVGTSDSDVADTDLPDTDVADTDVADTDDTDPPDEPVPLTACPAYSGLHSSRTHLVLSHDGSYPISELDREVAGVSGPTDAPLVTVHELWTYEYPSYVGYRCEGTWRMRCDADGLWLLVSDFACDHGDYLWSSDPHGYEINHWDTYADWGDGLLVVPADGALSWDVAATAAWTMEWSVESEFSGEARESIIGTTEVDATFETATTTALLGGVETEVLWDIQADPLTSSHPPPLGGTATGWWEGRLLHSVYGPVTRDFGESWPQTIAFTE